MIQIFCLTSHQGLDLIKGDIMAKKRTSKKIKVTKIKGFKLAGQKVDSKMTKLRGSGPAVSL